MRKRSQALCMKHGSSKGNPLTVELNSAFDENRLKLLLDLFHNYEDNKNYEDDFYWSR